MINAIEQRLLSVLAEKGPIRGTAQVGFALWPDRFMQPQGAAFAASNVIRMAHEHQLITLHTDLDRIRYEITQLGREALATAIKASKDERQLEFFGYS